MEKIIVVTTKEWNINNYFVIKEKLINQYEFFLITNNEELILCDIEKINPKYIFFPHWSWIIPSSIYEKFNCIVFHMTDLPFGKGGSPLQNLIINKIYQTKISAIKVTKEIDSGDIYLKENLDISKGNAEIIFLDASNIIFNKMIPKILNEDIVPTPQNGESVYFKRRNPSQSDIVKIENINMHQLYDFIRMLDAPEYPKAFIKLDNLKIELSEVSKKDKKLFGKFEVFIDE